MQDTNQTASKHKASNASAKNWLQADVDGRVLSSLFWIVIAVFTVFFAQKIIHADVLQSMESTLLDIRLRLRSEHYMPSEQIIILSSDRRTSKAARNYPELEMGSRMLPREKLADVITYLSEHGAKAIVLDVELNSSKKGDAKLAEAITKAGNVYAATMMDENMGAFIRTNVQELPRKVLRGQVAYTSLLKPYFTWWARAPFLVKSSELAGINGVLDLGIKTLPSPALQSLFNRTMWIQLNKSLVSGTSFVRRTDYYQLPAITDVYYTLYQSYCTKNAYKKAYAKEPQFLKQLNERGLNADLEALSVAFQKNITYCHTGLIVPELMSGLKGMGAVSVVYNQDAFIRDIRLAFKGYNNNVFTYLGAAPVMDFMAYQGKLSYTPQGNFELITKTVQTSDGLNVLINWRNPALLVKELRQRHRLYVPYDLNKTVRSDINNAQLAGGFMYRHVSVSDLLRQMNNIKLKADPPSTLYDLNGQKASGMLSWDGKIVIYGDTVKDIHRTPIGKTTYGPEIVANTMDMLLNDNDFIKKASPFMVWGMVLPFCLIMLYTTISSRRLMVGFFMGLALVIFYWAFSFIAFDGRFTDSLWFPLVVPSLFMSVSLFGGTVYRYYIHDKEKHQLTKVFSNYVSPQIMETIVDNPETALENLTGEKKELTVLFSDLQGFTQQFEHVDPSIMVEQLNRYFDVMTEIILDHGGTYDKYMGDAIMAFFGAPVDVPDHAAKACLAALAMNEGLIKLNAEWQEGDNNDYESVRHGIGISTGEMFVGNFGSRRIKNFTVMGSNVNLGARLESQTRHEDYNVIISERTAALVKSGKADIETTALEKVEVKGFTDPVAIFGLTQAKKTD